ncbi:MAG TPA: MIP/aquaporin family protein [Candidatus Polarisedimenticolia bacterium]|nr:MIP/aquaporin family protein [Candidatus Polarisedimenticolia bacterium]
MDESRKAMIAEAIGTFALVFVGAGSICLNEYTGRGVGLIGIALAHGLILSVAVSATGAISGGHLNPAVTFGFLLTGRMSRNQALQYLLAQLAGATVAAFFLRAIFAEHVWRSAALGTPDLAQDVTTGTGIFIEAVLTFLLVFAVWGTAVDERAPRIGGFGIGLTVAADILVGGPLTGAAMNPARSFGPALASAHWTNFLVYWIGPLLGAGAAAFLYSNFLLKKS